MRKALWLLVAAASVFLAGCQSNQRYYWGSYEDLVYVSFSEPGKLSPAEQIKVMEEDLRYADEHSKPVPPGFHAHLGYLYSKVGNKEAARANFETEKRLFPESAVLMDRLLNNLARM